MPWMWDCNSSNVNQKWRVNGGYWKPYWTDIFINPNDAYTLLAGNGLGMNALDSGGNYAAGARPAPASAINADPNVRLKIVPGTTTNTFKIVFASNPTKCLDHPLLSGNEVTMQVWDCNGGTNQNWYFSNAQNGGVVIKNQWSGKCLDTSWATSGNNGAPLATDTCADQTTSTDPSQIWALSATDG